MENELKVFIKRYESVMAPLRREAADTYFKASVTGDEALYKKAGECEVAISKIYARKDDFAFLKKAKEAGSVKDGLLKRELEVLYDSYLVYQGDEKKIEEIINKEMEVTQKFSVFRAEYKGKKITDNEVNKVLRESKDSGDLKEVWESHKSIGKLVAGDVLALVKLRNELAVSLDFKNYHEMQLLTNEQDPKEISSLFDELAELTKDVFLAEKKEIDRFLAKKFCINEAELMPWHYGDRYFQEAPEILKLDLNKYFKDADPVKITIGFFKGLGLEIEDIIANSDLYEKPGKNQHAYCMDVDKAGDIRVLCNVKPDFYWMNTMLHEFGHAVYDKYLEKSLPYVLRSPAHIFTTEAVAMFFGRLASEPQWLKDVMGITESEKDGIKMDCFRHLKLNQLVFSSWSQVMYRFEKSLYEDPDGDLNRLWWDLVEKYQLIKRPVNRNEPDWASKIHIATSPCYYHNYQLGEMLASQILNFVNKRGSGGRSFAGDMELGGFLKEYVFKPGSRYKWDEMIEKATKEKLTPKYYAKQFLK